MTYFTKKELSCTCCGEYKFDAQALYDLNAIRADYGRPIIVTSGYRCPKHPIEAKKVAAGGSAGAHSSGKAVDLGVGYGDALKLLKIALMHGVPRVGVNQKGNARFIHLDWDTSLPHPTIWSY